MWQGVGGTVPGLGLSSEAIPLDWEFHKCFQSLPYPSGETGWPKLMAFGCFASPRLVRLR